MAVYTEPVSASALAKCAEADACLHEICQGSQDDRLLNKALSLYREAAAEPFVEPYLGIAFIMHGLGAKEEALGLLISAQKIDAEHPRLQLLFDMFLEERRENQSATHISAVQKIPSKPLPQTELSTAPDAVKRELPELASPSAAEPESLSLADADPDPHSLSLLLGPAGSGSTHEGPQVKLLQSWLCQLGHQQVESHGHFDKATHHALQAFQMKHRLPVTGQADKKTRKLLNHLCHQPSLASAAEPQTHPVAADTQIKKPEIFARAGVQHAISKGPGVLELQTLLHKLGYEQVKPTGAFDLATQTAVRSLQKNHKLPANGIVNAETRQKIEQALTAQQTLDALFQELEALLLQQSEALGLEAGAETQTDLKRYLQRFKQGYGYASANSVPEPQHRPLFESLLGTPGESGALSQGDEVSQLQALLCQLAYPVQVNGQFDLQTYTALRTYQQTQGLPPSGTTDSETCAHFNLRLQAQNAESTAQLEIARHLQKLQDNQPETPDLSEFMPWADAWALLQILKGQPFEQVLEDILESVTLSPQLGPPGRPGRISQGPAVELLQLRLQQQGLSLQLTGVYDQATYDAVRKIQAQHKLGMTGLPDENLIGKIQK